MDELSLLSLSLSSCSVALDVLQQARERRDQFWTQPTNIAESTKTYFPILSNITSPVAIPGNYDETYTVIYEVITIKSRALREGF